MICVGLMCFFVFFCKYASITEIYTYCHTTTLHYSLPIFALLGGALLRRALWFNGIALTTIVLMIAGKIALMTMLVSSSIGAGLFLIAAIGANVSRTRRRRSAQRENPVSGLPNFEALRSQAAFGSATVEIGRAHV